MSVQVNLSLADIDPAAVYRAFVGERSADGRDGAIVSMVGLVRARAKDGRALAGMTLEYHDRATPKSLADIGHAAAARFALSAVRIIHRVGDMTPGQVVVLVMAAAAHRRSAFDGVDYIMDRLKSEAVFWKRETGIDGSRSWIEPTPRDAADLARWQEEEG